MIHIGETFRGCHEQTFEYLFKKYRAPMVTFARRFLFDHFMAEEFVSDVFCRLWEKLGDFNCDKAVKSFLYVSVRNQCLNHLDRRAYLAKSGRELLAVSETQEDFVLNTITRGETLEEAYAVLQSLPDQCRKVVLLKIMEGHSTNKIAEQLKVAVSTVHNQRLRGIKLMQERFARMQKMEGCD
jgi:RNA polymerase sigma-70 factor (family 1)